MEGIHPLRKVGRKGASSKKGGQGGDLGEMLRNIPSLRVGGWVDYPVRGSRLKNPWTSLLGEGEKGRKKR